MPEHDVENQKLYRKSAKESIPIISILLIFFVTLTWNRVEVTTAEFGGVLLFCVVFGYSLIYTAHYARRDSNV